MLLRATARGVLALLVGSLPMLATQETGGGSTGDSATLLEKFEPGEGSLTFQLGVYDNGDSGDGNPFLDEALTVIEPVIIYDYDVSDRFGWGVELSYDNVSSASIDRLSNFDDQSGASGDNYVGADFSFRHAMSSSSMLRWHIGYSDEYDYDSFGLGARLTWQPDDADATVAVGLDLYQDFIDLIRFDGDEEGTDNRTSLTLNSSWYQVLTPSTSGDFGLSLAFQTGFLETPYNAVVIEDASFAPNPLLDNNAQGMEITEELPEDRIRLALYGKVRTRTRPGRAWELGGRLYGDDWDIRSVTLEPRFLQSFQEDRFLFDASYRFYVQSEAQYFQESFGIAQMNEEFRTQDSDLGDFSSHALGLGLKWQATPKSSFNFGLDFVSRSDGLDQAFFLFGYTRGL